MKNIGKINILVLLLVFVILLSGCDSGKKAFEDDYQMFKEIDHVYTKSNYEKVYNALTTNKGYSIIVFAYDPDLYVCPFCMEVLPILNEVAIDHEIDEILYLDIRTMRVERTKEYLSLIDYIDNQVDDLEFRNELLEIIVPDVYVVKDGEILGHHIATIKDDEGKYLYNLNNDQKAELIEVYKNLLGKVKS